MASPIGTTPQHLARGVGLPGAPVLVGVRTAEDAGGDRRILPASVARDHRDVATRASATHGGDAIGLCQRGLKVSGGCTSDTMRTEFGSRTPAPDRLARIVQGADTARPELAPQAAGLLAASLGLARLDAGIGLYDTLHPWCRDAVEEVHDRPSPRAA